MKRIALLSLGCGMLLLASTAEARGRRTSGGTYAQPVRVAPAATTTQPVSTVQATVVQATALQAAPTNYSTQTAQGVANIMASRNQVGHFGGNTAYEGCGSASTPAAAYSICCYANSGLTTVDVGYAQSASGMWYCCRRYR